METNNSGENMDLVIYHTLHKLKDLHKQATEERSHYYVGSMCRESAILITQIQSEVKRLRDALENQKLKCYRHHGGDESCSCVEIDEALNPRKE